MSYSWRVSFPLHTGAISCALDGNNVIRGATEVSAAAAHAGDPSAYGIAAVHLYRWEGGTEDEC